MTENAAATTPAAFFSPGASIKKRTASATRLAGASCRIRTNDPEITNHVLWPTELKRQIHNYFIFEPLVGFEPTTPRSLPYRAATTNYLCCDQALEDSKGAGRMGLTRISLTVSADADDSRLRLQR